MTSIERTRIEDSVRDVLSRAVSCDYVDRLLFDETNGTIMSDIIRDIEETSDFGNSGDYNDDDIRLAIGRVLCARLGMM